MTGFYLTIGVVAILVVVGHFEKSKVIANQKVRITYLEREIKKLKTENEKFTTLRQCNK